jgi:hypothetical protein
MKSFKIPTALVVLLFAGASMQAKAEANSHVSPVPMALVESAKAESLTRRLDEINMMEKSGMNRKEKKMLRKEVKAINKELKTLNGGVYLSVGAIIIIILLLILLV